MKFSDQEKVFLLNKDKFYSRLNLNLRLYRKGCLLLHCHVDVITQIYNIMLRNRNIQVHYVHNFITTSLVYLIPYQRVILLNFLEPINNVPLINYGPFSEFECNERIYYELYRNLICTKWEGRNLLVTWNTSNWCVYF